MSGSNNAKSPKGLLEAYFDGGLSPEGEKHLREWLEADPAHMEEFVQQLEIHVSLWEKLTPVAGEERVTSLVHAGGEDLAGRRRRAGSRRRRGISKTRAWLRYGVLPAAVAAAALITAHLVNLKIIADTQAALCAEVIELGGPVEIVSERGTAPIHKGSKVRPGESLQTGAGGRVKLRYQDRTTLEVRERTDLSLKKNRNPRDPSKSLKLTRGELSADVVRQKPDAPMTVITRQAVAKVLGTRFTLKAEAEKTRLEVTQGKVRLTRGTQSVEVAGGSFAEAGAGIKLAAVPLPGQVLEPVKAPVGDLRLWMRFDGDFKDSSPSKNHGKLEGAERTPKFVAGKAGRAVQFDGVDDNVCVPHSSSLEIERGSVELWFSPGPMFLKRRQGGIFCKDTEGQRIPGHLRVNGNRGCLWARIQTTTDSYVLEPKEMLTGGQWYHVVMSFGPKGFRLYVDGKLKGRDPFTGGINGNTLPIWLGCDIAGGKREHGDARLDELAIYAHEMTGEEVRQRFSGKLRPDSKR